MRILLQRVSRAEVRIRAEVPTEAPRVAGRIGCGYVVLAGFTHTDTLAEVRWMVEKIQTLRLFPDVQGRMNQDLREQDGALLVVSQFTLYGDARKGRRPSFISAAPPNIAEPLYTQLTGVFGAMMDVELTNDGPVTLWLEREAAMNANVVSSNDHA
jgi:D-tyrosyl-tRNA(Tyr) deacylase